MYVARFPVSIEFPLGSDNPGTLELEPGQSFNLHLYERSGEERTLLVTEMGDEYMDPRWRDIKNALEEGDLVEI